MSPRNPCLLFLFILTYLPCEAQEIDNETKLAYNKNTASFSLGFIGFYGSANLNYERLIAQSNKNTFWLKFGGGLIGVVDGRQYYILTGPTMLTGRKNNHLEISLGVMPLFDSDTYQNDLNWWKESTGTAASKPAKSDYWSVAPAGLLGYRYQKPKGHFMFRAGLGFPELLYVGLGIVY